MGRYHFQFYLGSLLEIVWKMRIDPNHTVRILIQLRILTIKCSNSQKLHTIHTGTQENLLKEQLHAILISFFRESQVLVSDSFSQDFFSFIPNSSGVITGFTTIKAQVSCASAHLKLMYRIFLLSKFFKSLQVPVLPTLKFIATWAWCRYGTGPTVQ